MAGEPRHLSSECVAGSIIHSANKYSRDAMRKDLTAPIQLR